MGEIADDLITWGLDDLWGDGYMDPDEDPFERPYRPKKRKQIRKPTVRVGKKCQSQIPNFQRFKDSDFDKSLGDQKWEWK